MELGDVSQVQAHLPLGLVEVDHSNGNIPTPQLTPQRSRRVPVVLGLEDDQAVAQLEKHESLLIGGLLRGKLLQLEERVRAQLIALLCQHLLGRLRLPLGSDKLLAILDS
eukprot:scaffold7363_cov263-Pinguiococcus_pyrenoidosus.AAC.15